MTEEESYYKGIEAYAWENYDSGSDCLIFWLMNNYVISQYRAMEEARVLWAWLKNKPYDRTIERWRKELNRTYERKNTSFDFYKCGDC